MLRALYANTAIRYLSLSLASIFIPVYIFTQAQKVYGNSIIIGLYAVIIYYLLHRTTTTIFTIPAARFLTRYGFISSISIGNIALAACFVFMTLSQSNFAFIILAAFFEGIAVPYYWLAHHMAFTEGGKPKHFGRQLGLRDIFARIPAILGPLIGGIIITLFGFSSLFLISLLGIIFSAVPFLTTRRFIHRTQKVSVKRVVDWFTQTAHRNEEVAYIGRETSALIGLIFYPIFIYIIGKQFELIGLMVTVSMALGILSLFITQRLQDKYNKQRFIFNVGALGATIVWMLRPLVISFSQLFALDIAAKITGPFFDIPFDSMIYKRSRSKSERALTFLSAREIYIGLVYYIVLALISVIILFDWRWVAIFSLAAVGLLISTVMWEPDD